METRNDEKIVVSEETTGAASKSSAATSPSSSPSHEFSFTVSLHSSQTATVSSDLTRSSKAKIEQQEQESPLAIDLSPADDIFFHGHLLPLHFLSHLHASSSSCSPRTSTATPLDDILYQSSYEEKRPVRNSITHKNYHYEREVVKDLSCKCQKPSVKNNLTEDYYYQHEREVVKDLSCNCQKPSVKNNLTEDYYHQHEREVVKDLSCKKPPVKNNLAKDYYQHEREVVKDLSCNCQKPPVKNNLTEDYYYYYYQHEREVVKDLSCNCRKPPNKPSLFSLSGFAKWVKGPETKEKTDRIKRLKYEVGQFLRRYIKMAKPLVSPKERRHEKHKQGRRDQEQERKCYSYSGSLSPKIQRRELRDLRGEYSAPASMRTSPKNSGLLVAKEGDGCSHLCDSSMDDLHSAIQSAIAHCKSSVSSSTSHVKSQDSF
ncbi:hypothetical protein vseg_017991 [Gypsophila vaccaria]